MATIHDTTAETRRGGSCRRYKVCARVLPCPPSDSSRLRYLKNSVDVFWGADYTTLVPGGVAILNEDVDRLFTTDDKRASAGTKAKLSDMVQEIMQRHVNGIDYREWNAGDQIDDKVCSFPSSFPGRVETRLQGCSYGSGWSDSW